MDVQSVLDLLRRTGAFRPDEVDVAEEIMQESLAEDSEGHYANVLVEDAGRVVGWSCHGRVPMTASTFDLYWIAVDPDCQSRGVGGKLLAEVERRIGAVGGLIIVAETSDSAKYAAARSFYERNGYQESGRIPDYYIPGDGRVVYTKRLTASADS